ncbi:hypothetical protein E2562_024848 [Oryza meyeriana var. granulata]|uniref:Uncharacterized protein n=1 Tax=Oryza meyeriana var. granulata TaxID=110450 RepID=A0A6G1CJ82_9ORYZ|nr:hypothetical protein E2562_024848 [Oryza meyeriana var. granulata]
MAWREGNWFHQASQDWRRGVGSSREEEGSFFLEEEREAGGRLGFFTGSGHGRQTGAMQGRMEVGGQRWGLQPRGGRSVGARRGGFAGRPGRGMSGGVRLGQAHGGLGDLWPVVSREGHRVLGRAEAKAGGKEKLGNDGAAKMIVGGGGLSNGGGAIKVGEMDVEVRLETRRERDRDIREGGGCHFNRAGM